MPFQSTFFKSAAFGDPETADTIFKNSELRDS